MTIEITPNQFLQLAKKAYSLDMLYLLKLIEQEIDIEPLCSSARVKNIVSGLLRKGLITEKGLSLKGKELLEFISENKIGATLNKKKDTIDTFDTWWKAYPGTDTFKEGSKIFKGSRSLRVNKEKCRIKFNKILNEGEYDANILITAMLYDVTQKKQLSIKKNENKLTYMQNSLTYLNQRSYEPFIELIQSGIRNEISKRATETDI